MTVRELHAILTELIASGRCAMTAREIITRLRDYQQRAEKRARENRYEHRRHEARGSARAYRNAIEWIELIERRQS